jgi:hypothetical protein
MDNYNSPLISIQGQIDGIRSDIFGLNAGLTNIGTLLQNDRIAERVRLQEEEQQERALIQQQIRVGQETEIEKKVTSAIATPIKNVEDKVSNTFNGISAALTALFGSISTLGIRGLGFAASTLGKTINGTKSLIANSLRLVTGALSSIGSGFGFVFRSINGLTKKVSDIIFKLASSPFKAISNAFKSVFSLGGVGRAASQGAGAVAEVSGAALSTFGKLLSGLAGPAAAVGIDIATGEKPERSVAGGVGGTAGGALTGAAAGSIFGPAGSLFGGIGGYFLGSSLGKSAFDTTQKSGMTFAMPNINLDMSKTFGQLSKGSQNFVTNIGNILSGTAEPKKVDTPMTNIDKPEVSAQPKPTPLPVQPYKPSAPAKDLTLPEPKPDVVMMSTISGQQNQQAPTMTAPEDVPFISSSNPNNFYVLYSQLNYNVVM